MVLVPNGGRAVVRRMDEGVTRAALKSGVDVGIVGDDAKAMVFIPRGFLFEKDELSRVFKKILLQGLLFIIMSSAAFILAR